MNGLMDQSIFYVACTLMIPFLMSLAIAVIVPGFDRWSKRFFIAFFTVILFFEGFCLAERFLEFRTGTKSALQILYYLDSLSSSTLVPMLTAYLLHCCGENLLDSRLFRLEIVLWIGIFVLLNTSFFTNWVYYILPENRFCRGSLYPLLLSVLFATVLLALGGVIRRRKRLVKRYYFAFLISLIPMAATMLLHYFANAFALYSLGIVICVFSMFIIILSDQIEQNMQQQQEIIWQRTNIMVLQMRPHFIYNTLMSIYSLCNQDPQKARQVTMDFTSYLHKNFNAIASRNLIPFSEELEHTRAYLAVEKAQHDELLIVEYDTPFTQFRLPPLTLQPIVENAIKHGINPFWGPLTVMISTRHTNAGSVVTVKDNGPGFPTGEDSGFQLPPAEDSTPHTALTNIRQRLEIMCGGKLEVAPREGGGTTVTLTIPDRKSTFQ